MQFFNILKRNNKKSKNMSLQKGILISIIHTHPVHILSYSPLFQTTLIRSLCHSMSFKHFIKKEG